MMEDMWAIYKKEKGKKNKCDMLWELPPWALDNSAQTQGQEMYVPVQPKEDIITLSYCGNILPLTELQGLS